MMERRINMFFIPNERNILYLCDKNKNTDCLCKNRPDECDKNGCCSTYDKSVAKCDCDGKPIVTDIIDTIRIHRTVQIQDIISDMLLGFKNIDIEELSRETLQFILATAEKMESGED
jgi:hypothetical protein